MPLLLSVLQWSLSFFVALHCSYELLNSHIVSYSLACIAVYYGEVIAKQGIERLSLIKRARIKFHPFSHEFVFLGSPLETVEYVVLLSVLLAVGGVVILWGMFAKVLPLILPTVTGWNAFYRIVLTIALAPPLALLYRLGFIHLFSDKGLRAIVEYSGDCPTLYQPLNLSSIPALYIRRSPLFDARYPVLLRVGKGVLWLCSLPLVVGVFGIAGAVVVLMLSACNMGFALAIARNSDYFAALQRTVAPGPTSLMKVPYKEVSLL